MPNLQDIRRRIASVKSTQKITHAMKMVAASKLHRAQEALLNTRPYTYHMRELTNSLLPMLEPGAHPLLNRPEEGKVAMIVISSDHGLCGGYNTNIVHETMRLLQEDFADEEVELTLVGRKGIDALRRRPCTIREKYTGFLDNYSVSPDTALIDPLIEGFINGEIGQVHCLYNEFKSAMTQRIALERLLPYEFEEPDSDRPEPMYIFEPSAEAVIFALLRENLYAQMHRIFHEAMASEQGARMVGMDAATNNARNVIADLTLKYNRVRQDAITTEMVEIISGAEAL